MKSRHSVLGFWGDGDKNYSHSTATIIFSSFHRMFLYPKSFENIFSETDFLVVVDESAMGYQLNPQSEASELSSNDTRALQPFCCGTFVLSSNSSQFAREVRKTCIWKTMYTARRRQSVHTSALIENVCELVLEVMVSLHDGDRIAAWGSKFMWGSFTLAAKRTQLHTVRTR